MVLAWIELVGLYLVAGLDVFFVRGLARIDDKTSSLYISLFFAKKVSMLDDGNPVELLGVSSPKHCSYQPCIPMM